MSSATDTFEWVTTAGGAGLTVAELREDTGWHHGVASSALSSLHASGKIVRLKAKRDRCHVYVAPQHAGTRETAPYGVRKRPPAPDATIAASMAQKAAEATARTSGYQQGLREGRKQGEQIAFDSVEEFTDRLIQATKGVPSGMHHSNCYTKHPVCMARAIKSFVSRTGAMT